MNERETVTPQDILGLIEHEYDESGTANYGCFDEVFRMARIRANLLVRFIPNSTYEEEQKKGILNEIYQIVLTLPGLHDATLAKEKVNRLQDLMPI